LTAKLGAGWIATAGDVAGAVAAMSDMQERRRIAGRETEPLDAVVLTGGAILEEGDPPIRRVRSPRPGRAPQCCCTARPTRLWRGCR
jgi:hypothetical protein